MGKINVEGLEMQSEAFTEVLMDFVGWKMTKFIEKFKDKSLNDS